MFDKLFLESNSLKRRAAKFWADCEENILVSVVMTFRNPSAKIYNAIESIVSQKYKNWQLILVDDNSVNDCDFSEYLDDERFVFLKNEQPGRAQALNLGLKNAAGSYVAYLDADNVWDEAFLSVMLFVLSSGDAFSGYCAQYRISSGRVDLLYKKFDRKLLESGNYIDLNAFVHKNEISFLDYMFDNRISKLIDWDFIVRLTASDSRPVMAVPYIGVHYDNGGDLRISNTNSFQENDSFVKFKMGVKRPLGVSKEICCNFCGYTGSDFSRGGTDSPVFSWYQVVGGGLRNKNICPSCGSFDRERIVYKFLENFLEHNRVDKVLYVAPDRRIVDRVKTHCRGVNVVLLDLFPKQDDVLKGDITALEFPDRHFDVIICNHVLEHVRNDAAALAEFNRVLTAGGVLVAQVPYSKTIFSTFEDETLARTPESRAHNFGQEDHVRVYERDDYVSRVEQAGFSKKAFPVGYFDDVDFSGQEIFVFDKIEMPASLPYSTIPKIYLDFLDREGVDRSEFALLGGWSIDIGLLVKMVEYLDLIENPVVLELGSGFSTKILAKIISNRGGRLVSFEHNVDWYHRVDDSIRSAGLSDCAAVYRFDIQNFERNGHGFPFYSEECFSKIPDNVNLVIADGPPGFLANFSRMLALPAVVDKADKNNFVLVLDDYDRYEEKIIVESWLRDYDDFSFYPVSFGKQACFVVRAECGFMSACSPLVVESIVDDIVQVACRYMPNKKIQQTLPAPVNTAYESWLKDYSPREVDAEVWAERMLQQWHRHPHMTILVMASQSDRLALQSMLEQMQAQLYKNWRLVVLADWSAPSQVFLETDYLGWLQLDDLGDPQILAEACNGILEVLPTDWVTLLPAGANFAGEWLFAMADHVNRWPDKTVLYTDHDHLSLHGGRVDPWFKPDFDPNYFYAMDYIGFSAWFSAPQLMAVGGFAAAGYWQHYDAILRLSERYGRNTVGHVSRMLLSLPYLDISTQADEAARSLLLQAHFERSGIEASVLPGKLEGTLRIEYLHESEPLVSIIIPNRDKLEFLEPCVETLLERTRWPNWELLIVDNQSSDPDTLTYYRELEVRLPGRCRIVPYDAPFNFSAQCNLGATEARGDYLLLLNNDTEIVHAEWLDRMMAHAMRPEVGVVGCRLLYPESGKIQHAGVAFAFPSISPDGAADHPFIEAEGNAAGYMNRIWVEQNWSAVTAACLLTRKQVYEEVGGFDAAQLAVLFNDVDYCLKVGEQGYQVLYTPFATLVHHGSVSINSNSRHSMQKRMEGLIRAESEREVLLTRWRHRMAEDPAMNPNLSIIGGDLVPSHYAPHWDVAYHQRARVLGFSVRGGSGAYRIRQPLYALAQGGLAHAEYVEPSASNKKTMLLPNIVELTRLAPDTLFVQNPVLSAHHDWLESIGSYMPDIFKVASIDDLLSSLPEKSSLYAHFQRHLRDAKPRLRKGLALCDRLIVSTEPLREFCSDMIDDIRVVPNRLPKAAWSSHNSLRGVGRKPRIGWVGALQHAGDLALLKDVIRILADEVEWVFMGMWPEGLDDVVLERHEAVSYEAYPAKMASLNLDLAIAPLETNAFNEAKSNLRLLEYGVMRWPVVCSDVYPYRTGNPPVTRVSDAAEAWVDAIRQHLADPAASQAQGEALRRWVEQEYWLEDHLDEWLDALQPSR